MLAFEVQVNGHKLCTAGVGDKGHMNVGITLAGDRGPDLHVGGMQDEQHVRWLGEHQRELRVGDEVTVRVLETESVDEPLKRFNSTTRAEKEHRVLEHLREASALLPVPLEESSAANGRLLQQRLAENHLLGAMDVLETLGDTNPVSVRFWQALSDAAHTQTAYEDRNRYTLKSYALEAAEKGKKPKA